MRLRLTGHHRIFAKAVVCALLLVAATRPATASIPTRSDVAWIGVGIAAIGAGIGIGIYYAVHHSHSLTGCAVSGASGLELQSPGDQQTYALVGEIAGIKSGERIRVSGKKEKKSAGGAQQFIVEKLNRDYGSCAVQPAGH
jgi:hypothetical protein